MATLSDTAYADWLAFQERKAHLQRRKETLVEVIRGAKADLANVSAQLEALGPEQDALMNRLAEAAAASAAGASSGPSQTRATASLPPPLRYMR